MTLIVCSDFDPEGLDLGDDACRSLRDLWDVPADYHRVGINREQIGELDLADDFNPAKVKSSRYAKFVRETGGNQTWELEALPPDYLQEQVRIAIEENMDMTIYEQTIMTEQDEAKQLAEMREGLVRDLDF